MLSVILSAVWLPEMSKNLNEFGITIPSYINPVLILIAILSFLQIIAGFIIDRKVASSQALPKSYQAGAMLLMLINSTLLPLIFALMSFSITQAVHNQFGLF